MIFINILRNNIFWFLDFLNGSTIRKHLREIEYILENYHSKKSSNLREQHLANLLEHAVNTTPFYKTLKNTPSIEDFPVVDKLIITTNFESLRSEKKRNKKYYKASTSGSTGTPFVVFQDANKRKRTIADTIYFAKRAGFKFGSKLVYMKLWNAYNKKNTLITWIQNIKMQDVSKLDDNELKKLLKTLTDSNEKGIIAYSSSLNTLCAYLDKIKFKPYVSNINSIIAFAEHLNENTKSALQKYFMTPVVSRYSNSENGILSQQTIYSKGEFEINSASFYIEILKVDEDKRVTPGESGRVVVTDLFNYCMPIIRYDTGDIARIVENEKGIPVFEKIEGRKLDLIFNTKGQQLSAFLIGGLLDKYISAIAQYQFIQEDEKEYTLRLNLLESFKEGEEEELIAEFKDSLGHDCKLTIDYVDEIPLLASGKRKEVASNYKPKTKV